jgi:hypothetical protein
MTETSKQSLRTDMGVGKDDVARRVIDPLDLHGLSFQLCIQRQLAHLESAAVVLPFAEDGLDVLGLEL